MGISCKPTGKFKSQLIKMDASYEQKMKKLAKEREEGIKITATSEN